ncbi:MAG TPA: hypothetical protein VK918_09520 [Pyrinomonadaceae bacterium]|nr:hypothetical protein [Pyrinomonadaceae bacterium]
MYRRSIFLDVLIAIRQEMAREADYDVDLFVERARSGKSSVGSYKIKDARQSSSETGQKVAGRNGKAKQD